MSKRKYQNFINLSDSDDSVSSTSDEEEEESEWSGEEDDQDADTDEEGSIEEEDEDEDEDSDSAGERGGRGGGGSISRIENLPGYQRLVHLLNGGRTLEAPKLEDCKAYLRKHGLRITGTKEVIVQRILEHLRIKDGNGEKMYPRSSFSINCTGDVCKGDVVVFTQRVYEKFDKMTRGANPLGKRTVAGRVVKESYGAAKQQHTFTIEVLWSKGFKKLPPLFPLLVKGRNLYRLRTFRQHWNNEADRSKVLAEKHKRGSAARHLRAMKKARSATGGRKRTGDSHKARPLPKRRKKEEPAVSIRSDMRKDSGPRTSQTERAAKAQTTKSSGRPLSSTRSKENGEFPRHPFTYSSHQNQQYETRPQFHPREAVSAHVNSGAFNSFAYGVGSTSRDYTYRRVPGLHHQVYNHSMHHPYDNSSFQFDTRRHLHYNANHRQINSVPLGVEMHRGFVDSLRCPTPGCGDRRDENCVAFSCWRCCRRMGWRCLRHHT